MELIASINSAVNGVVWGAPMLVMLIGVGLLMTVRSHGLQFRKFGYTMRNTFGKLLHKGQAGEGEIRRFLPPWRAPWARGASPASPQR